MKQYADDTTLSLASRKVSDLEEGLTSDVEGVSRWVKKNKLRLNVKKTQMLLLGRKRRVQELERMEVKLDGQTLTRDSKVKCLGVWVDDELTWRDHVYSKCEAKVFWGSIEVAEDEGCSASRYEEKVF